MAGIGIIAGLIGSAITQTFAHLGRREDRLMATARFSHEENGWNHERDMATLQSQAEVARTEQDVVKTMADLSREGMVSSQQAQTALAEWTPRWTNGVVSLVRPVLTFVLIGVTLWHSFQTDILTELAGIDVVDAGAMDSAKRAYEIVGQYPAMAAVVSLTEMAVAWWFGDRSAKRVQQYSSLARNVRAAGGEF